MSELSVEPIYLQAAITSKRYFNYGDVIPMQWLYDNFDIKIPDIASKREYEAITFDFLANIEAFKSIMLKENNMMLVNIRGVGYRILNPNEQPDEAMTRLKTRVRKETVRAMESLSYINEALLSDESAKKRDSSIAKIAALSAFSKTGLKGE